MSAETKEHRDIVPLCTYRHLSKLLSLSLGQGSSTMIPDPPINLAQALAHLDIAPNDEWMWEALPKAKPEDLPVLIDMLAKKPTAALIRVLLPYLEQPGNSDVIETIKGIDMNIGKTLLDNIPTLGLRTSFEHPSFYDVESAWNKVREQNRVHLRPIPDTAYQQLLIPKDLPDQIETKISLGQIKDIFDKKCRENINQPSKNTGTSLRDCDLTSTGNRVFNNPILTQVLTRQMMLGREFCGTHVLDVPWNIDWRVDLDRANYHVLGTTGVSGKGLTREATIASGLMELAERVSAIAGATPDWPKGYKQVGDLLKARLSELKQKGVFAVDPNDFYPSIPYSDQGIYWIEGQYLHPVKQDSRVREPRTVLLPAQKAFHMANLDEPSVLRDSSNGLASGNTPEEAKLHALLEVIERDGCYTTFVKPDMLFTLPGDEHERLGQVISKYHKKGLHPAFIDLTTDFGVPTYRAYIQLADGHIITGSGAHLNGNIALNRAICELSAKCLGILENDEQLSSQQQVIEERGFSDIPDFSNGNVQMDLVFIESVLRLNGYPIIYADLTRTDIDIPVVRAIVPGLDCPFSLTTREVRHFLEYYQATQV